MIMDLVFPVYSIPYIINQLELTPYYGIKLINAVKYIPGVQKPTQRHLVSLINLCINSKQNRENKM